MPFNNTQKMVKADFLQYSTKVNQNTWFINNLQKNIHHFYNTHIKSSYLLVEKKYILHLVK